ncbi:hypothetical protein [Paenibacillus elgii]|uniref:hypothetical protein n=1 Tax=Paenibacillus elgii TaxID=189691 RepID=UPI0013D29204|nr:hypothetical protein [Paenibacillus elgii]
MIKLLNKVKAPVSFFLSLCLIFTLLGGNVFAKNATTEDGFEIIRNDRNAVELKGTYQGDELYGTFDKSTHKITLRAVEKAQSLLASKKVTKFDVNVLQADEDEFEATIINKETKKEHKFKEKGKRNKDEKVKAQLPLLIPIADILGAALIRKLLAAGLAVVIFGVTYVAASELADTIRNKDDHYYAARIYGGTVVVAGSIDYNTAYNRVNMGEDVFCKNEYLAQNLAAHAGKGYWVGPHVHGDGSDGYYHHYHPWMPALGRAHVFFFNY